MRLNALQILSACALAAMLPLSATASLQSIEDRDLSMIDGQVTVAGVTTTAANVAVGGLSTAASVTPRLIDALIVGNPLLLPLTLPLAVIEGATQSAVTNAGALGASAVSVAFMPLFRPIEIASDTVDRALDLLLLPVTAPIDAVFGPAERVVDGVTGRAQATVDGVAYALLEVTGPLVTNAFAGVSQAAGANGLTFTSRVFGRIAQAQAGRTNMHLEALETRNGY